MKVKNFFKIFLVILPLLWGGNGCTKLDTTIYDKAVVFWQTPEQVAAGVAPAYTQLRLAIDFFQYFPVLEGSTDEFIVPTRGGDWTDGGRWAKLWMHTWDPSLDMFESFWQYIYTGIVDVNTIIQSLELLNPKPSDLGSIEAELKTVRAYYYFQALDLFGNVPIIQPGISDLSQLGTQPSAKVFAYVENEIRENMDSLSTDVNQLTYGRATRWFAQAILAKLYLNAQVYTGTARWTDCIAACDSILQSNSYILEPNYFTNFAIENEVSRENIFSIPFDINANLNYFYLQSFTLHYNSGPAFGLDAGGANGPCFPTGFYDLFDPADKRYKMFLVGQQYVGEQQYDYQVPNPPTMLFDGATNLPLNFDPNITQFSSPDDHQRLVGARCAKFEFNKIGGGLMSNDFPVFRLADIILMKAEAQFRNGDAAGALATINQTINGVSIRSRANMPDFSAAAWSIDTILNERGRELAWEGWRRNDLIRFGHFTDARVPDKAVSASYRTLYPIPILEIQKNKYLVQNPGY